MNLEELSPHFQIQAKILALQTMLATLMVRHLQNAIDTDDETKALLDITLGSIAKFELKGENTEIDADAARALMGSFATDTINAAAEFAKDNTE